jgi:hypothetical protein
VPFQVNTRVRRSPCHVALPLRGLDGGTWRLQDLAEPAVYDRRRSDRTGQGLCLDMPASACHVFAIESEVRAVVQGGPRWLRHRIDSTEPIEP